MELKIAWFWIEGDNVYFRGVDRGETIGEYAVPLFDGFIAKTVANYLSTPKRAILYDPKKEIFVLKSKEECRVLQTYKVDGIYLYDFRGWAWLKKDMKNPA